MNVRIRARVSNFRVISDVHLKTDHCLPSWAYAKGSSTVCVCVCACFAAVMFPSHSPPLPGSSFLVRIHPRPATAAAAEKKRHRHLYMMPQPLSRLPNPLPPSRTRSTCSTTAASGVPPRQRGATTFHMLLQPASAILLLPPHPQ